MLTVLVHPDQLDLVPPEMKAISTIDLVLLREPPAGLSFLADASVSPFRLPWMTHPRVLNGNAFATRESLLWGRGVPDDRPAEYPAVLRAEFRGGCRQSPLLFSEEEEQDVRVDWILRYALRDIARTIELVEDPFAPFVSGSFLKLGSTLIPGRRMRFSEWHSRAESAPGDMPQEAEAWAASAIHDVVEITYLEQNGRVLPWRADDGAAAFLAYLADRPEARDALHRLAEMDWDSGDISGK